MAVVIACDGFTVEIGLDQDEIIRLADGRMIVVVPESFSRMPDR
jgi:hypothetical protein